MTRIDGVEVVPASTHHAVAAPVLSSAQRRDERPEKRARRGYN